MGEFLKSVQDELYLKSALGFIKDQVYISKTSQILFACHIVISRALDIYGLLKMVFDCLWVVVDVFEVVVDGC